jgi:hypothetical protein
MKLVKFKDGKFGIKSLWRYWHFGYGPDIGWWDVSLLHARYYRAEEKKAREILSLLTDKGEVVK